MSMVNLSSDLESVTGDVDGRVLTARPETGLAKKSRNTTNSTQNELQKVPHHTAVSDIKQGQAVKDTARQKDKGDHPDQPVKPGKEDDLDQKSSPDKKDPWDQTRLNMGDNPDCPEKPISGQDISQAVQLDKAENGMSNTGHEQEGVLLSQRSTADSSAQLDEKVAQDQESKSQKENNPDYSVNQRDQAEDDDTLNENNSCDDDLNDSENHEMEVEFQYEADLPARYLTCKKNPGHVNFIPASKFSLAHLPSNYQDEMLVELVREQAKLAVRLKIKGSSPHRPKITPNRTDVPYPFSSFRYRFMTRVGSGWVLYILNNREEDQTECPCSVCQQSGDPRKVWTKVKVATAAHVVYDNIEGSKCTCHLLYDTDDTDLESCPSLNEVIEVESSPESDHCFISYAIHDSELALFLDKTLECYKKICRAVKDKYKPKLADDKNEDLSEKIANLYERCLRTNALYGKQKDKIKAILEGDLKQQWQSYSAGKENVMDNLDSIGICLLDKLTGGGKLAEQTLANLSGMYEESCRIVEHVGRLKDKCEALKEDDSNRDKVSQGYLSFLDIINVMDRNLSQYETNMDSATEVNNENFPRAEPVYDPTHPLTVIVSHPHGCSKKITVGHITEKSDNWRHITSHYTYDNATCPGCSGARVFILGRVGSFYDHAHSGGSMLTTNNVQAQINKSVIQGDV